MKIDVFDLVEGLFEGTLAFFYNILETAWTVLSRPIAGPEALVRKRAATKAKPPEGPAEKKQVGGVTFLFICFLAFMVANALLPWGPTTLDALVGIVRGPGEIDIAPIWPAILGAIVAAAIVDVALRIASLILVAASSVGARDEAVTRAEYALLWPLLALAIIIGLTLIVARLGGDFPNWLTAALYAGLLLALPTSVPPVLQIQPELGPVFAKPWKQFIHFLYAVAALAILNFVVGGSLILGLNVAASLQTR